LSKNAGGDLVDREIGDLVPEQRVKLGSVLENRNDLGHEGANVLIIFLIRLSVQIFDADNGHVVFVKEGKTGPKKKVKTLT
jgi:hypothetical protein